MRLCFGFFNQVEPQTLNIFYNLLVVQIAHIAAGKNNDVQPFEQTLIQAK